MKVLVVGSGGREHALAWKISQSHLVDTVIIAPGNVGMESEPKCRLAPVSGVENIRDLAREEAIDLAVIGPEQPLTEGITEALEGAGAKVFGPSRKAADLEGSKIFAKEVMSKRSVPTASYEVFDDYGAARDYVKYQKYPLVIKADGLAAGKGVIVCRDDSESVAALNRIMVDREFREAGDKVLIEECLDGEEASFIAITDGKTVLPLEGSQDHKPVFNNDQGPNTGGMGAYSPAPVIDSHLHGVIMDEIMRPMVDTMAEMGNPYMGFLYAGLMINDGRPKVLEFNVRMGDPEAQPLLFRMESDIVPLMLAAIEGSLDRMTIDWAPEDAVCVVMASGGYPGSYEKGKTITGVEQANSMEGVKVFHAGSAFEDGKIVTAGGRVLGVTAKAMGIEQATKMAYGAVELIKFHQAHYRTDIAAKAINRA